MYLELEAWVPGETPLIANFSAEPTSRFAPLEVNLTDLSWGGPVSWLWHFGDGDSSMEQHPLHEYSCDDTGYFDVRLIIWSQEQTDTMVKNDYIYVFPELGANFGVDQTAGIVPLTVQFMDSSLGCPTSWLWNFGDDSTDTVQNPVHAYSDTGSFDVRLIVSNPVDSDTMIKPDLVAVLDTLRVDFTAEPTQGRSPLNVSFQSLCNVIPDDLTWHFGDGDSSKELNPVHQYTEAGSHDVKLVAELFDYKDSLTKEDYIWVSDIKAEFAADTRCGPAPLTVAFSDNSTGTYPITEWHWDFGDGETSDQQNPTHEFVDVEVFDITLVVSDGIAIDTLTKRDYITTQETVSAEFVGFPTRGLSPLAVMFEPILEGIANQYLWDFGDGETSSLPNPIHIYTTQGEYDVKLVARLELNGCDQVDSLIEPEYIMVNDLEAQFSADPTAGIASLWVEFTDESSGDPDTWFWDFGDGNTSAQQHPSHWYDTAGVYDVFLRVRNFIGADSLLKLTYILVTDTIYPDLFAEIYDPGSARPGFDLLYYCVWTNTGSHPAQNCTLRILLPPEMTFCDVVAGEIRTGTYSGYTLSGDTIIVPLGTIHPSDWYGGYIYPYGNLPETVQIGDTLICQSWLTSTTSELDYDNNYVLHSLEVTGSIDPNDKLAYPEGKGLVHAIEPDQRINYTIQFENKPEATAEAIYVRVVDTLDQDLDWGSLAIGASSHPDPCDCEFDPYTGEILWFCDSIMLPPNANPPEGEGYFTFSISPEQDLPAGTQIVNTAWIRFDYNEWLQAPEEGPVIRTIKYSLVGDANGNDAIEPGDVVYLLNYLFRDGAAPVPYEAGDCNYDGVVDPADVVYLINYLFRNGPPPRT
jgi:PKD repeat protein